jgi:hypothetical protein
MVEPFKGALKNIYMLSKVEKMKRSIEVLY